jgi:hypothetical protein
MGATGGPASAPAPRPATRGRHRGLIGFAAGVFVTLAAGLAVLYLVVTDQRQSARLAAVTLSRALSREVRVNRITELGPSRIVMRGVTLPQAGGWPVTIEAESVEATGPLTSVAGLPGSEAAPVQVVVTRPTVTMPGGSGGAALDLAGLRDMLAGLLGSSWLFEIALLGGRARQDGTTGDFDLVLRKRAGQVTGELVLRAAQGPPFALALDARLDGAGARLGIEGRGPLAPLAAWLPETGLAALADRTASLVADVGLPAGDRRTARARLAIGGVGFAEAEVLVEGDVVRVTVPRATADLAALASAARLPWKASGSAEIGDGAATWRLGGSWIPQVTALVRLQALSLPAAAGGGVVADALEARVGVESAGEGVTVHGELSAPRLRAGTSPAIEVASIEARYRLALDAALAPVRVDLDPVRVLIAGVPVRGRVGQDLATGRVSADLEGETGELGGLVRHLAPGVLTAGHQVRATGLRLSARDVDARTLDAGTATLQARALALERPEGRVEAGPTTVRAVLGRPEATVSVEAAAIGGSLLGLAAQIPRISATAAVSRGPEGVFRLGSVRGTARDAGGRDLLLAEARPAARAGWLAVSARVPALAPLDPFWPTMLRGLAGSARFEGDVGGAGEVDGRLALELTDAELPGRQVSLRGLRAEIPIRRGADIPGEPPWGAIEIGEAIGYGVVIHDIATPARIWKDRLSLNDLSYVLYSGGGKGWSEIDLEPAGVRLRGKLTGEGVRIEEFMSAYGIRGGTMTGLLRYDVDYQYQAGQAGVKGRLEVPGGGTVNIEILDRLLSYADADPTGIVRRALGNLRVFDYKSATAEVQSGADDIRVSMSLKGRELFGIFPPRVQEINVHGMPLNFLARQFPAL